VVNVALSELLVEIKIYPNKIYGFSACLN